MLTQYQHESIERYLEFQKRYPSLFQPREHRHIVLDRGRLERFAERSGQALGVLVQSPYLFFLVDLVESEQSDGSLFEYTYLRVVYRHQLHGGTNVAVVGTISDPALGPKDAVILLQQERHATGRCHLEIPRGFGEEGLSGEENALKELSQETGFIGEHATLLGETFTDTGLTDAHVAFYHVPAVARSAPEPEMQEALEGVVVIPKDDLREQVRSGKIDDAFTVQALALLEV